MKKILIPILLLLGIGINVIGQERSGKELRGDKYFFNYSFEKAIDAYTHTKELSVIGQHNLAESYRNLGQNIQAEGTYQKLMDSPTGIVPEDYYNYAMVLKANGKYEKSRKWMDKFEAQKPNDLRARDYTANKAKLTTLLKDDGKYKIEHLNVNSAALDFGTSYYKDKIVFASTRTTGKMIVRKYNWTGQPFWDMYISDIDGKQLKEPEIFEDAFNRKFHDGPATFSRNGDYMAFTRNDYDAKRKDKVVVLQLFFSSYADGKWSEPESFAFNSSTYSVGHPYLKSDGNTMYFVSDMPGGFGGTDIYKTTKVANGSWSKPENLGNQINTEGDEMFPFLQETKNVFAFASNGRYGIGGLDVFFSDVTNFGFGPAYNAGVPLNTQYDDYAAIVDETMKKGYFSSNRTGGSGGDDIYSFDLLKWKTAPEPKILFAVNSPRNAPVEQRIRETFPIRNYVFFDLGSTEIPNRYVLLNKDQVKDFKEDQLEVFTPKQTSGRAKRQMVVYYNVLNILGDRMGKNPTANIVLVGSSEKGSEDGKLMAGSVKNYLVDVFGITPSRIAIEGREKPKIPSEQPGGVSELELLRQGDRRVSIEASSPALLMEFQSGPDAPLKPVEIKAIEAAQQSSNVTFSVSDSSKVFNSWSMEMVDKNGKTQYFGPYTEENVSVPGKTILGNQTEGDYKVTMIGLTKSGDTIRKDTTVKVVLLAPAKIEELTRFSIIFEFDDANAIAIYEKYLMEVVTPKIPIGGTVIIRGHTDIIGDETHNQTLSLGRANAAKTFIENGLAKAGRTDVKFEVSGTGEDLNTAPFDNKFPEERFYNRTVIIDIVPKKQ
ncbi:MAG: hypothetical protein ACOYN4_12245 [Bacteroidales bacterium]